MRQKFHIDFIKKSKIFFCISLGIMLVCFILNIFAFHTKVDIQFTGGTIIKLSFDGDVDESEVKQVIKDTLKDTENFKGQSPEFSFSKNLNSDDKLLTVTFSGTKISTEATAETSKETSEETSAETSAEASKTETSTEASKTETSTEASKAETSAEASKAETSAEASKAETSAEASKAEASAQTSTEASETVQVSENSAEVHAAFYEPTESTVAETTTPENETSKPADEASAPVTETSKLTQEEKEATGDEASEPVLTIGAEESGSELTGEVSGDNVITIGEDDADTETTKTDAKSVKNVGSNEDIRKITKALQEKFPDANFKEVSSTSVDPSKGTNFFLKCMTAVILAAILMIFYVALRFRKIGGLSAGVMAVVALIHDLIIVYFVFVIFQMPINDNFIAVVLMILGYSLNDTIVIYDRIRENRRKSGPKANIGDIVNTSLNQCMVRTICTSITTIIAIGSVLVVSLMYNIDSIVSFALPMMIGLISGSYSSLCIAAPLWVMWKNHQAKKKQLAKENGSKSAKKKAK